MPLEIVAFNYQGVCIVEAGDAIRRVRTHGGCNVLGLVGQGNPRGTHWWHQGAPYYRSDQIAIRGDCGVTIMAPVSNGERGDWSWRSGSFWFAGPADFNVDGAVDVFDFLAFQTAFAEMDMSADFDADGELTFWDFLAFFDTFGEE